MIRPFCCKFHSQNIGHTEPCKRWRVAMCMFTCVLECCIHYKESTRMHKNPTTTTIIITTTLPFPRATRAKSTKRHVENEARGEGRTGGARKREKGRMKEKRDKAHKTTQSTKTYSNTADRGRMLLGSSLL